MQNNKHLTLLKISLGIIITLFSCQPSKETRNLIYTNNFETADLTNISQGKVFSFNQTKVLGNYNKGGFQLQLNALPAHQMVEISFDLYIHDSWDGNNLGTGIDGPDIWSMYVDGATYINTTFYNIDCPSGYCPPQSYPDNYPNSNHLPKEGAYMVNLPSICGLSYITGGTSLYRIKKTIPHQNAQLNLKCWDTLIQTNSTNPACDESWSIDNLKITTIHLN